MDSNIKAHLVYDGGPIVFIPPEMGEPAFNQLVGTVAENLSELCCRVCYDSLGKGRSSELMHGHLLDVKHWSVYEHYHFTVELQSLSNIFGPNILLALMNRTELQVNTTQDKLFVTMNLRHLLDWFRWSREHPDMSRMIFDVILGCVFEEAPNVFKRLQPSSIETELGCKLVGGWLPNQQFVTLYLSGSRGMSHEQVRHRFNISQRSTRYVDEDGSDYVEHPLITKFLESETNENNKRFVNHSIGNAKALSRECYRELVDKLQGFLLSKSVDKFTARKQARGAARNYLGNGLATELMFTANLVNWRDMLKLRCNVAADAEIRVMYGSVLRELKASRFGDYFSDLSLVASPDGIGEVLNE